MAVKIVEVGPRDGLQYEKKAVDMSAAEKLQFIKMLVAAGLKHIEAGSFVSPKWVPQMGNSADLATMIAKEQWPDDVEFSWLVPNEKGLDAAVNAGVQEVAVFIAANDEFSKKNINATIEESLARIEPVIRRAKEQGIKVRGYLSTIFAFGDVVTEPEKVAELTKILFDMGCYEVSLGDTTGVGRPDSAERLMAVLEATGLPMDKIAAHFHDTGGMAIENCKIAYKHGIRIFDSAAGGLGGCPYADSPKGNLATEDLVSWLESVGEATGVTVSKLADASIFALKAVGKKTDRYVC